MVRIHPSPPFEKINCSNVFSDKELYDIEVLDLSKNKSKKSGKLAPAVVGC